MLSTSAISDRKFLFTLDLIQIARSHFCILFNSRSSEKRSL